MVPLPRRRILKLTSIGITAAITGCISGSGGGDDKDGEDDDEETWPPEITTTEPELTSDDRGILTVNISNARSMTIDGDDKISFERENADISPDPEGMLRTNPGRWIWGRTSTVEIRLPVVVDKETQSRKYSYEVNVSTGRTKNEGKSVTETFELPVTE